MEEKQKKTTRASTAKKQENKPKTIDIKKNEDTKRFFKKRSIRN